MRFGATIVGVDLVSILIFANDDFPFAMPATFVIPGLRGIFSIQATWVSPEYTDSSQARNDKSGALKGSDGCDQVLEGMTQPIVAPSNQGVAGARIPQCFIESRPIGPGTGDDVPKN